MDRPGGDLAGGARYSIPATAIVPLRLFLGVTFLYAAIQKLTDPGFFKTSSTSYIGTQIQEFSRNSPIQFLLKPADQHAVLAGVLVIAAELLIGAATVTGFCTRIAAVGGVVINLTFFLSASWTTYPYFLGSDIVFVMAWLTLALAGPGPLALDSATARFFGERAGLSTASAPAARLLFGSWVIPPLPASSAFAGSGSERATGGSAGISRAEAIAGGAVALVMFVLGVIPRSNFVPVADVTEPTPTPAPSKSGKPTGSSHKKLGGGHHPKRTKPKSSVPEGQTKIGNVSQLPGNSSLIVTDPESRQPDIIIHTVGSEYFAYSAICTHAGCEVGYDPSANLIVCPCHGSEYDPTNHAAVVRGPAPRPLPSIPMTITAEGDIYIA